MPEVITQSVGGKFWAVSATFARPANATAYTAGDIVSNSASATTLMKFAQSVRGPGGSGAVVKARLVTDLKTDTAVYRLILFTRNEATVSVPADNALGTTLYANRAFTIGQLDFPALTAGADTANNTSASGLWTGGVGSTTVATGPLPFVADQRSDTLVPQAESAIYGVLVNTAGSTPASGQNFYVELTILQN